MFYVFVWIRWHRETEHEGMDIEYMDIINSAIGQYFPPWSVEGMWGGGWICSIVYELAERIILLEEAKMGTATNLHKGQTSYRTKVLSKTS